MLYLSTYKRSQSVRTGFCLLYVEQTLSRHYYVVTAEQFQNLSVKRKKMIAATLSYQSDNTWRNMRKPIGIRIDTDIMQKVREISDVEGIKIYRIIEDCLKPRIREFETRQATQETCQNDA